MVSGDISSPIDDPFWQTFPFRIRSGYIAAYTYLWRALSSGRTAAVFIASLRARSFGTRLDSAGASGKGHRVDENLRDVMGCTCLRIRRTSRRMTQVYDHALQAVGLTINQFGLLANLYGVDLVRSEGLSIGAIAERLGADPTTLNRTLKPLKARGLVRDLSNPADGRVRIVRVTEKGKREFLKAIPVWRKAQAQVEGALGAGAKSALNDLLDRCSGALTPVR